jgi:hypothetical protein
MVGCGKQKEKDASAFIPMALICSPKYLCGLGFTDLQLFIQAML